jgi:polysaccharide biosynthesis protein PslH
MSSILVIIPFTFYPPVTGGALRCYHLIKQMSLLHNISVITVQPKEDFFVSGEFVFSEKVEIWYLKASCSKLPASNILQRLYNAIYFRFLRRSIKGVTNQFLLDIYPVLKRVLNSRKIDIILFENLEAVELTGNLCKKISPSSIRIYDAHNVDSELWLQLAISQNETKFKRYATNSLFTERNLCKRVDSFFCCSVNDQVKLLGLNENRVYSSVIPNGVDVESKPFDDNQDKFKKESIIFCGTLDTVPNKEGLLWFYNTIFPKLKRLRPSVSLTVIGKVTQRHVYDILINDPSVNFIGNVEDVVPYYRQTSVAIAPLLSGSGTRLKILEAMSLGNPIVSTWIGAEGISCIPNKNIFLTDDPDQFAKHIDALIGNEVLFNSIRREALKLVKDSYDWKVIGTKLNEAFNKIRNNGSGEN